MKHSNIENVKVALVAIKSQMLRSLLTALIITIGISALVGILTAIDALKSSINNQFSSMGANSFSITPKKDDNKRRGGIQQNVSSPISYAEAMEFKKKFDFPTLISISCLPRRTAVVKFKKVESNPNIPIFGVDENYVDLNGFTVDKGRNFNPIELTTSAHTVVLGSEIAKEIFNQSDPIDKVILVSNVQFRVIGVLKEKGSSLGFGGDRNVLIPLPTARQFFGYSNMGYTLAIMANSPDQLDLAINEATGVFRSIRHDRPGKPDSFTITRSDSLSQGLIENLDYVGIAATIIAFITLLGAAIGLMNIMLVSVTERTREIGIRKALGATTESIKYQFLTEAVMVCQFGGAFGIIVGILIGNLVGNSLGVEFIIPWNWILVSVAVTFFVGIAAGFYPAQKAAQLDPIESLRYE